MKDWNYSDTTDWHGMKNQVITVIIENGITSIGSAAFYGCSNLTSIEIPNGVTSIEAAAFYECSSLTSMKIPSSVTTIGSSAFYGCEQLIIICKSETAAETYAKEKGITYQIDDQIPNINITQNGTETKVKSATSTVLVTDELAGVDKNNLKYLWSEENDGITKENITNKFENGETLEIKDETGIYYLWIYARDNVGNEIIQKSNAFYIDNTPPTANVTYSLSRNNTTKYPI